MTPLEVLRDARFLISDPAKWTQGANARDAKGELVFATSRRAVCFCAEGSLVKTTGAFDARGKRVDGVGYDTYKHASVIMAEAVKELAGTAPYHSTDYVSINDGRRTLHGKTAHEAILTVFDLAIQKAAAKQYGWLETSGAPT
jgi:hypothetical protein